MSDILVSVRDLYKSFEISYSGSASLKTALLWWKKRGNIEKLDVLKGISFDVHRGECLSLIGRNGAGKSTLLALIAKVYKPTSGVIESFGRVAPLLELGAGFHPDLSGQENVLFNAMMLGLSRKQASERLERIVEFSELGHFISAPVRTYSSGMQARLGFAVAINVDADVLIVDEVLAVGDISFEHKCLDYIQRFRAKGGAIILVTHNLVTVEKFSDRALFLKDGVVVQEGRPSEVIPHYRAAMGALP